MRKSSNFWKKLTSIVVASVLTASVLPTQLSTYADNNSSETYSVYGEISGFAGGEDELLPVAVVAITPVNSKTPEYVTTGVNEYSFDSVVPGEYVLSVAARGEYVTHEYKITVVDSDVVLDTSIYQLGDTNHDGIISEEDCDSLPIEADGDDLRKESEKSDYDMAVADVNYDGTVDEKDANLIRQFFNGGLSTFPRKEIVITDECQKAIDEKLSVDEEVVLDSSELIVTLDEEFPIAYFLANHEVEDYEVFIGENDWGIHPFIGLDFADGYSIEEEASVIAENNHIIYMHPSYFIETDCLEEDSSGAQRLLAETPQNRDDLDFNDEYFPYQVDYYTDMGLLEAWNLANDNMIRMAKIAIIDLDLNYNHPDLVNIIDTEQCYNSLDYVFDGEWTIDNPYRDDFTLNLYTPDQMLSEHGTAVTSLIASEANNSIGITGAASGGTNELVDVFFYNCSIEEENAVILDKKSVYRSIINAISQDVDIINMSFGRPIISAYEPIDYNQRDLLQAAYNQGITLVAAGGNLGSLENSICHENGNGVNITNYPSDWEECIATCSLFYSSSIENHSNQIKDSKYRRATYSDYNVNKDISAYGTKVWYAKSSDEDEFAYANEEQGTSFAAPIVTSVIGLMVAVNPWLTNEQIYDIIKMTAIDITYKGNVTNDTTNTWGQEIADTGYDVYTGYGMINAARCVEAALQLRTANHIYAVYPNCVTIPTNSNYQLTGYVVPNNLYNNSFLWMSSDSTIASVDQYGVVTAHRYGTVTITSTSSFMNSLTDGVIVKTRYYDVNDISKYYYDPVYWAADNEITRGYDNVYFLPEGVCDRKSMAIFLWRMSGRPEVQGTLNFSDTNYTQNSDTYKAILWAYISGITLGYSDGTFRPDNPVTRKDAIIMLYRTAGNPEVSGIMPFSDVTAPVNSDTYKSILWAYNNHIANGYSNGTFGINENCKRADIVTFLYRYNHLNGSGE